MVGSYIAELNIKLWAMLGLIDISLFILQFNHHVDRLISASLRTILPEGACNKVLSTQGISNDQSSTAMGLNGFAKHQRKTKYIPPYSRMALYLPS